MNRQFWPGWQLPPGTWPYSVQDLVQPALPLRGPRDDFGLRDSSSSAPMRLKVSSLPSRRSRLMRGVICGCYNTLCQVDAALRIRINPRSGMDARQRLRRCNPAFRLSDRLYLDCEQCPWNGTVVRLVRW
jgi:hypothetical protein